MHRVVIETLMYGQPAFIGIKCVAVLGSFSSSAKEPLQSCFVRRRRWRLCTPFFAAGLDIETSYLVPVLEIRPVRRTMTD